MRRGGRGQEPQTGSEATERRSLFPLHEILKHSLDNSPDPQDTEAAA